jgi:type I restriction enzyme S subunit
MTETSGVPEPELLLRTSPEIAKAYARAAVQTGDVILSIGPSYGKVMLVPSNLAGANLTQGTDRLSPSSAVHSSWLYWALQSKPARDFWAACVAGGTFRALNLGPLGETPLSVPPLEEQRRIADFLDHQVSLIDDLIKARARAIDLRLQRRRSITENLVWAGLGGGILSPTGIGPAPLAPSHWKRLRNKVLLRESRELSRFGDEELLSVSHLTGVNPRSEKSVYMFMAESMEGYRIVHPGDLVINTLWAWMGAIPST